MVDRQLGKGAMATVFLAHDLKHGREVAIKVLTPEVRDSITAERFLREIRTTARLNHPHILALFDSGEADGLLFYVMPYVPGRSLAELLADEGRLSVERAVLIARKVAEGLEYAHSHDTVHRDVKPGNVMVVGDSEAWIADFGLSRALHAAGGGDLTTVGMVLGSPLYMSPEQINGSAALDARSDIYGLGCVLYEMLAGKPPFTGDSVETVLTCHLIRLPPPLREVRPDLPEHICSAVHRALAKHPHDRFRSAAEFARALGDFPDSPAQIASHGGRTRGIGGIALAVVMASIAGAAGFGLYYATRPGTVGNTIDVLVLPPSASGSDGRGSASAADLSYALTRAVEVAHELRVQDGSQLLEQDRSWRSYPIGSLLARAREAGAEYVIATDIAHGVEPPLTLDVFDTSTGRRIHHSAGGGGSEPTTTAIQRLGLEAVRGIASTAGISLGSIDRMMTATESPTALTELVEGRSLLWAGDSDAAIRSFRRALASDSGFAPAYYYLSYAQLSAPHWDTDEALRAIDAGLSHRSGMPPHWVALLEAQRDYLLRNTSAAIQTFHQITGNDPTFVEAWLGLAEAHYHLSGFLGLGPASALPALERLIELDSTFAPRLVATHVADAAIFGGDEEAARRHILSIQSAGDRLAREVVATLRFGTRREQEAALRRLAPADLRTIAQAAYLTADDPQLLERVASTLSGPDRPASDHRVGARFRFAALAGAGRWTEALQAWHARELPTPLDTWMVQAYFAGFEADDLVEPMFAYAERVAADSLPLDFTEARSPRTTAHSALVHRALLIGDSAAVVDLLQGLDGAIAGPADPEPDALRATLLARLALLARDTTIAVEMLERSLSHAPWSLSDYYSPLEDACLQRILLVRLHRKRGELAEAQRWAATFGKTLAVSDVLFTQEVTESLALARPATGQ